MGYHSNHYLANIKKGLLFLFAQGMSDVCYSIELSNICYTNICFFHANNVHISNFM